MWSLVHECPRGNKKVQIKSNIPPPYKKFFKKNKKIFKKSIAI